KNEQCIAFVDLSRSLCLLPTSNASQDYCTEALRLHFRTKVYLGRDSNTARRLLDRSLRIRKREGNTEGLSTLDGRFPEIHLGIASTGGVPATALSWSCRSSRDPLMSMPGRTLEMIRQNKGVQGSQTRLPGIAATRSVSSV